MSVERTGGGGAIKTVADFTKGVVVGSGGDDVSTAKVAGDVVGALVPGLGEVKAVQDIYTGLKEKDPITLVGGIIGLVPVVGAAGKALAKTAKGGAKAAQAGAKVANASSKAAKIAQTGAKAAKVAKTGAKGAKATQVGLQGFKASALALGEAAVRATTKAAKSPEGKKRLAQAAQGAAELALVGLVDKLTGMRDRGEAPEVETRRHSSFIDARKTVEEKLGEKPGAHWYDLEVSDDSGKRQVVGRHDMGERGFRFVRPEGEGDKELLQILWWVKNGDRFGMEECEGSRAEIDAVMRAYSNRSKSFRSTRSAT